MTPARSTQPWGHHPDIGAFTAIQTITGLEIVSQFDPYREEEELDVELLAEAVQVLRQVGRRAGLTVLTPQA